MKLMYPRQRIQTLGWFKAFLLDMFGKEDLPIPKKGKAEEKESEYPLWRFPVRTGKMALGWVDGPVNEATGLAGSIKGVSSDYRSTHFYVVGATGSGKSKFLQSLIIQDIIQNEGFGVIDPTGDLIKDVMAWLYFWTQKDLKNDIVLVDLASKENTVCFNPLEPANGIPPERMAKQLVEAFKKIWADAWGERMADIMRNALIALVENNLTLLELPLLLTERSVRKKILANVKSPTCLQRFRYFESLPAATWREWLESTLNKVDAFISDPAIRRVFTSSKSTFSLRDIMDNKKILLVNLANGDLSESSNLLGALLVSKIKMAAFSRNELGTTERVPFYLYIDEFQNFATDSFVEILSEARKYKLSLTLAHQNLSQLPEHLRDSILANCGIQCCFRVNREDADRLARELMGSLYRHYPGWELNVQRLQELPRACFYAGNKIDGSVVPMQSLEVPNPWELIQYEEGGQWKTWKETAFRSLVRNLGIGAGYVRSGEAVDAECTAREKQLMAGEETDFRKDKAPM